MKGKIMKKSGIVSICLNIFILYSGVAFGTVADLCAKKETELTCADLHYTAQAATINEYENLSEGKGVCTRCPVNSSYASCAKREMNAIPALYTIDVTVVNRDLNHCEVLPTCTELGYTLSVNDVKSIPKTYSCSACPLDGNLWACAGPDGLVRP